MYRALSLMPLKQENTAPVVHELNADSTKIGAADDNAIVLTDKSISPHHLEIRHDDGIDHLVVDLAERWRRHDATWFQFRDGDAYWCPRHGNVSQLDERNWCPTCKHKRGSLWLIRPLHPGETFDIGKAYRATYLLQERAPKIEPDTSAAPAPKQLSIPPAEEAIPVCAMPLDDSNLWRWQPAGIPFPIFMHHRVNVAITQHAREYSDREVGGVLLGDVKRDEHGQMYVVATHAIKAEFADETRGHITFTHNTWLQIHRARERLQPDKIIVGWYHTHPGWTIFLSQWDLFIHTSFFRAPWQIALVVDPSLDRAGFFVWKDNQVNSPHKPIEPFRLAEIDGWADTVKPRVRIKLTDTVSPVKG
ncbi:MAG: Mov34/MPN/PAD-1 family protein [Chloroflexi bacterium]|nr:Mov34/MPN/PAD-1 family protein [Chloroflexota bacterium]